MKNEVYIFIGDCFAARTPTIIKTILGSCVAVCLFDPIERIGGMNHILLPGEANFRNFNDATRYAVNAMEILINQIMALGGDRRRLVAKVFGGADMLESLSEEMRMGTRNAEFVLDFLQVEDIGVLSRDLGGSQSRLILFHTDTGEVFLRRGITGGFPQVDRDERSALGRIKKEMGKAGDVTIFNKSDR